MESLSDPERDWEQPEQSASLERGEIESRLGPTAEPFEMLAGGRANTNVRVGRDRVLRIYRRDPASAGKEKALLCHPWESFAVPAVVGAGDDFLVLEYVAHGRLGATAVQGRQAGRALAEIHRRRFREAGFLGPDLLISAPFDDAIDALESHLVAQLERADAKIRSGVTAFVSAQRDALRRAAGPPVLLHGDFKASNLHATLDQRLLVLDWEFAYSGPALMDVGQLLRWYPPERFVSAFAATYRRHGGELHGDWRQLAAIFDLFNLAGLLGGAAPGSRRAADVARRVQRTLSERPAPFVPPC